MNILAKTRHSRYSLDEIKKIIADRESHPEMTTSGWCKQFPISEQLYYTWLRKVRGSKPGKKLGRPIGPKNRVSKRASKIASKPVIAHDIADLLKAIKEAKHWENEVKRLYEAASPEAIRAALAQFT